MNIGDPDSECEYCEWFDGKTFTGAQLRFLFPDLKIIDRDEIHPRVHMTLWGKDTCKCRLYRRSKDYSAKPAVHIGDYPPEKFED